MKKLEFKTEKCWVITMDKGIIKFEGYMIQKFTLEKIEKITKKQQKKLSLNCNAYKNIKKGQEESYKISMNINLYTNLSKIELVLDGFFTISKKFSEENLKYFLEVSAPAILYPYARSFISSVTAFDADETTILPVINFAEKI